jgi:hypothetical protein
MRKIFNKALTTCLFVYLLFSVTSCGSDEVKAPLPPHIEKYEERFEATTPIVKANLYYDNTQSMYGFISHGAASNFVITIDTLLNLLEGYRDYSLNTLRPDISNTLVWTDVGGTSSFTYRSKDFYTYSGRFARRTDGPLQLLFDSEIEIVDFDAINIFTTDLAEQNMRNIVLARKLNDVIIEREDYAFLIYCIESRFIGMAAVPLHGVVSTAGEALTMAVDKNFNGVRPFFVMLTGPTIEILKIDKDLSVGLNNAGLEADVDYHRAIIMSKRGIQESDQFDVITLDMEQDTPLFKGITRDISNKNFNFITVTYEDLFRGVDRRLPGLNFHFSSEFTPIKAEKNHGMINCLLPLNNLVDGSNAENVTYKIKSDSLVVLGGSSRAKHNKAEEDSVAEDSEKPNFQWQNIDSFEYEKYLSLDINYLVNGTNIYQVSNLSRELEQQDFTNEIIYTAANGSGVLHVKIYLDNVDQINHDYIAIVIPINGKLERSDYVPGWIEDYNLSTRRSFDPNNPSATPEYFTKTDGLTEFYDIIMGKYSSAVEQSEYEIKMEKSIVELLVNIKLR